MSESSVIEIQSKELNGKIKKLNGGNLAPPLANEKAGWNLRSTYHEMNLALTRLHDAPLENAGMRLVDVHLIFANFHADENDPRNYYFTQTDDYIRGCIEGGTPIFYRLGASIEHSINKYFVHPPEDVDKWINIVSHIIRHYTEGWNCGYHFGIKYWEIWNEPEVRDQDGVPLEWTGSDEEFNAFYVKVAKELKKRFPHLLFGGPAHCGWGDRSKAFIEYCAKHKAPMDFYSYHCYAKDPNGWIVQTPQLARETLDKNGYDKTEIHLNEWHYFPGEWLRLRYDADYKFNMYENVMKGVESAAFTCMVMTNWQDTPLDMGCFYTVTQTGWGVYRRNTNAPTKLYYGMKAYGDIVRYPQRFAVKADLDGITALGGQDDQGHKAVLVSCFKTGPQSLSFSFDVDVAQVEVLMLDDEHNLEPVPAELKDGLLTVSYPSDSAVFILHF